MLPFADLFGAADPKVEFWGPPSEAWRTAMGPSHLGLAQNMGEIYCGILAVILILGAGISRRLLFARDIRFFAAALVLTLIYALGWYTPIFRLIYDALPGVDMFRRPADATFIIGFLIAVLTGYLVHRLLSDSAPQRLRSYALDFVIVIALAATAAVLARKVNSVAVAVLPIATGIAFATAAIALTAVARRIALSLPLTATVLVASFTVFDLAWNNAPNKSTGLPPSRYDALRPQTGNETVRLIKRKLAEDFGSDRRDRVELVGIAYFWPDLALAQGFDHLFGHNPLRLHDFALATGVGDTVAEPGQRTFAPLFPSYRSTFADLCGVRFIVTGVPIERIDKSLKPGDFPLLARTKEAYVYENPRALPRVMLVHDYRLVDFDELIRDGWPKADPRRVVLLDRPPPMVPPVADANEGSPGADGDVRILNYENTEVDIEVDAPTGGFLVVNDAWHPWWRAEVDGHPAEILKANVLFRAVEMGPGVHQVHFAFEPLQGAWDELKMKLAGAM